MENARKTMQSMDELEYSELSQEKIYMMNDGMNEVNGSKLSMIYLAFASENVAYFCGQGDTYIYMLVKQLPEFIFEKITANEFSSIVMETISKFRVKHKLLVKSLLIENEIEYSEEDNNIIAKFDNELILTIEFNDKDLLTSISGNL